MQNRVLEVAGDAAANGYGFVPDGTGVVIDVGEDGTIDFRFDLTTFDAVNVATGGGSDEVRIQGDAAPDAVFVDGSPLADTVRVTAAGAQVAVSGLAAVTRITGSEPALDALEVFGLGGRDVVTIDPAVSSLINAIADLGPQ